jgi:2-polyprenyl-6-methoxyphenol hydroxylase-like FAD-dependent oxidoreductase
LRVLSRRPKLLAPPYFDSKIRSDQFTQFSHFLHRNFAAQRRGNTRRNVVRARFEDHAYNFSQLIFRPQRMLDRHTHVPFIRGRHDISDLAQHFLVFAFRQVRDRWDQFDFVRAIIHGHLHLVSFHIGIRLSEWVTDQATDFHPFIPHQVICRFHQRTRHDHAPVTVHPRFAAVRFQILCGGIRLRQQQLHSTRHIRCHSRHPKRRFIPGKTESRCVNLYALCYCIEMSREICIVGGGLAGLTLGILLRRDEIPVQLHDAGTYPRHRVCGEFISGRGLEILRELNLPNLPVQSAQARTLRFFNMHQSSGVLDLPEPALAIDRATLDEQLALEFERTGGVLHLNSRWTESFAAPGLVRATGRRLQRGNPNGLLGVKAHARNVPLTSDLELHFSDAGYVGLSRQPNGSVNVCALFNSRDSLKPVRQSSARELAELFTSKMGEPLGQRLAQAEFNPATFAAVAGISLRREPAAAVPECRIGDSICMIPPMTGNGMSIALESAAIAAPFLREYALARVEWPEGRQRIARACDRAFGRRLAAAGLLQRICFRRAGRAFLLSAVRRLPSVLNCGFRLTR